MTEVTQLTVEDIYQKREQKEHVLELPDTYIGSVDLHEDYIWIIDENYQESTQLQNETLSEGSVDDQSSGGNNESVEGQTRMVMKKIKYVPGLYKIYDEILVNAMDHWTRMNELIRKQKLIKTGEMAETPEVTLKMKFKPMKNLRVEIDQENNRITVINDGDGIPVAMHKTYGVYVPELIFSQFLTSGNYKGKGKNTEQFNQIKIIGGKNGFGSKLTAAYSKRFTIETVDANRGKKYVQTYCDNLDVIEKPEVMDDSGAPYTKITFEPDLERFGLTELTDDIISLFKKRVYDAAGWCTGVNVFYNDTRIPIRDFNQYTNLYLGPRGNGQKRVYCRVNDRWEVCATVSEDNEFQQVSMVNGVVTRHGGRHVDHVATKIANKLARQISTDKNPVPVKVIKSNLWVFIRAVIENPSFDSQTKENMTTKVEKFGSKCEISDDDITKIGKCGVTQRSKDFSKFKELQTSKASDGKKTSRVYMDKLEDAAHAGSKKYSQDCTLILTEGDSAKEFAIDGLNALTADQRKFWGIFPLKGKPLNVRDAQQKQIDKNDEIVCLKKILALRGGEDYTGENISKLRYGRIMILSDSDVDGDHIKGLIINLFHKFWPSLLERDDFLCTMITPIVKVWKERKQGRKTIRTNVVKFYSENEYYDWKKENDSSGWKTRYYKGLGTSDDQESEEAFVEMKVIEYKIDPVQRRENGSVDKPTDQVMDLAFLKKNADLRKKWLLSADLDHTVDYNIKSEYYSQFINNRLIHFSWADTHRSIPNLCDGLKPSQRKVLYYVMRKKFGSSMKVSQLGGAVSKDTSYHHGEASLEGTIVGLAQNFVGAHNLNYLVPEGKFGSRYSKGKNHASSRYIYTKPEWLLQHLFKKEDAPLYKYLSDDGFPIEPEWYLPVIPTVLVNGTVGIGTGFSTFIPQHDPLAIIKRLKMLLHGKPLPEHDMTLWYRGFGGKIEKIEGSNGYLCIGDYTIYNNHVRVKELPIDGCFEDYKRFLENLVRPQDDDKKQKSFLADLVKNITTDSTLCQAEISFRPGGLQKVLALGVEKFERELKLRSRFSINNMTLFNDKHEIKKYSSTNQIIQDYFVVRLEYYAKRRELMIAETAWLVNKISAKYRFVNEIIDKEIVIERKPRREIIEILEANNYPKFTNSFKLKEDNNMHEDELNEEESGNESYHYLLSMQIWSFSQEMLEKLKKELNEYGENLEKIKALTPQEMWLSDLETFETEYIAWMKDWYSDKKLPAPKMVKSSIRIGRQLQLSRRPSRSESEEVN